jgi:predicted nuclease of predicted toxin-antitoxin system
MKFIVDAHLPKTLAHLLRGKGFDVVHTSELPDGNDTTDDEINRLSLAESRIVISKDADFYDSFTAKKEPYKLLHVKTGNIRNSQLIELFDKNLELIVKEIDASSVIQISRKHIIKIQ